jgi:hypothetical protein
MDARKTTSLQTQCPADFAYKSAAFHAPPPHTCAHTRGSVVVTSVLSVVMAYIIFWTYTHSHSRLSCPGLSFWKLVLIARKLFLAVTAILLSTKPELQAGLSVRVRTTLLLPPMRTTLLVGSHS